MTFIYFVVKTQIVRIMENEELEISRSVEPLEVKETEC